MTSTPIPRGVAADPVAQPAAPARSDEIVQQFDALTVASEDTQALPLTQNSFKICTQNVGGRSAVAGTLIPELRTDDQKRAFATKAEWPQDRRGKPQLSSPSTKGKADKPLNFSDRIIEGFRSCSLVLLQEVGANDFLNNLEDKLNGSGNLSWKCLRPQRGASFKEVVAFYDSSLIEAPVEINLAALVRELVDSAVPLRRRNGGKVLGLSSRWWYDRKSIGVEEKEHPIVLAFMKRTMTLQIKVDGVSVYIVNAHNFSKGGSDVFRLGGDYIELLGVMDHVLRALAGDNGVLRALAESGVLPENGVLRALANENGTRFVLIGDLNVKLDYTNITTGKIAGVVGNSAFHYLTQWQAAGLKRAVPRGPEGLDWAVSFGQVMAIANTSTDRNSTQMQGLTDILTQAKKLARRILDNAAPAGLTIARREELNRTLGLDEVTFVAHHSSDHPPAIFEIHAHIDV